MKKSVLLLLICFCLHDAVVAQRSIRDSSFAFPMIGAVVGYQFPGGYIAKRFGNNFNVGALFQWKLKSNWMLGLEVQYLFGDDVKETNVIDNLKTPDGNIVDANGEYAEVTMEERGFHILAKAGKIISFNKPNPNSGVYLSAGAGYLKHHIRIDTPGNPVPFLEGEYNKGYDRLCSGLALTEFLGYMYFSNNRLINFYAGLEFSQAFTKNRREVNFDTGLSEHQPRTDMLTTIRIGWVIPIYRKVTDKVYYY
jgi:hypothetical protein